MFASADLFGRGEHAKTLYNQDKESDRAIINAVREVADARGVSARSSGAGVARQQRAVTASIVGVTREKYLHDAIASVIV
jgi:aryl-alcohol dehydrogenase-like predicted oxidoreductase